MEQDIWGLSDDGSIDYNISYDDENKEYIVDIFDASIEGEHDAAYVETFECETLEEAVACASTYQLSLAA